MSASAAAAASSAPSRASDGVSASRRPVRLDLLGFAQSVSVMSTIIRAQYLFRANQRSYQMLQRAKRNKMKRNTELDMQKRLQAKLAGAVKTANSKFSAEELVDRAARLAAEQEAARAARAVVSHRRENSALSAVHADLAAQHERKRAEALRAQQEKSHAEMLAKIKQHAVAPSEAVEARRAAAEVVRAKVQDPLQVALAKDIKSKGGEVSLRSEARQVLSRRRGSVLIGALNAEIERPELGVARLKAVKDQAQLEQDQQLQEKLKNKRRTAKPQDFPAP